MAKPFKVTIVRYVDVEGRRCPKHTPGARPVREESTNYFGEYENDRGIRVRVPLCTDFGQSKKMLAKLIVEARLHSVGLGDRFAGAKETPLADHLTAYAAHLNQKGNTHGHTADTIEKLRRVFNGTAAVYPADLDAVRVSDWLAARRQGEGPATLPAQDDFTPAEVAALLGVSGAAVRANVKRWGFAATGKGRKRRYPRATVEALAARTARGAGPGTINSYVRALRAFGRWMVRDRRSAANPFDTLALLNEQTDVRRARRELTEHELGRLFDAARTSGSTFRGLAGADRYYLYLTAATTGFRAGALAALTPADFRLNDSPPLVVLPARFNKSRKVKRQPLPAEVASALRTYLAGKPAGAVVWDGTWARDHRGAEMLRGDLSSQP